MEQEGPVGLGEGWRAAAADDILRRAYTEARFDDGAWQDVVVPGHWRSVPAFAEADGPLLYRCRFEAAAPAAGRRAWLTFDGVFYQGDVWLDGRYLGDTEGYFLPHSFEVTEHLRGRSEHVLAAEVACSPEPDPDARRNLTGVFQASDHVDPAFNPGGIWRPVRVSETGPVRIASLRVQCREASPVRAILGLRAVLDSDAARRVRLRTEVGAVDHEVDQPLAAGSNEVAWTVVIERPELWWPHALGDPTLHDLRVAVTTGPDDNGPRHGNGDGDGTNELSDERRVRVGLRSVSLRAWVCSLNGERMFLKGAAHGPTRTALAEAEPAEVRADVARARAAGLDLLRVQGHVARPELYDAADESGLLVWQDMPLHGRYARGVRRQAGRQAQALVDLLGHHPSVAMWCPHDRPSPPPARSAGSIGMALAQHRTGWKPSVLDTSVSRALERADGSRPVVDDPHLALGWEVGDESSLPRLAELIPRIVRCVSGFGAASVPSGEGAEFADPERWPDLDWDRLAAHHGLDRETMEQRVPPGAHATFDDWRAATQAYQASLVRHHVETLRRIKYRPTGGFVVARLADAHPGITPSLLDHERRPKAALDALAEACRPVIVVAGRTLPTRAPGDKLALDVHVVSDRRTPIADAEVTATLSWDGGSREWRWAGDVGADACVRVGVLQTELPDAEGPVVLDLSLRLPDGELVTNRYQVTVISCPP
jgi:beta-mannosidase